MRILLAVVIASLAFAGSAQAAGLYGDSNGEGPPGLQLSDGSTAKAKSVSCTAMLDRQALKGTGAGGCTFKLPKTATKKTLVITTTGKVGSESVTSTDSFTVK